MVRQGLTSLFVYTNYVYRIAGASALLILGERQCEGQNSGIGISLDSRAFSLCFRNQSIENANVGSPLAFKILNYEKNNYAFDVLARHNGSKLEC